MKYKLTREQWVKWFKANRGLHPSTEYMLDRLLAPSDKTKKDKFAKFRDGEKWLEELNGIKQGKKFNEIAKEMKKASKENLLKPKDYLCLESSDCSERFSTLEELNRHKEGHKECECICHEKSYKKTRGT